MNAPAAIMGTFSDVKIIRSRKVCQLVVEVPLEKADEALAVLGGVPLGDSERWVGVARINPKAIQERVDANGADKPRREFHSLPYAQQAALRCNDQQFQRFLKVASADEAAIRVREECGVSSRSEIETDDFAKDRWISILKDFDQWQRGFR